MTVGLWLLLVVAPLAVMLGAAEQSDSETLRQQAVSQYIDGATKELDAFRHQINAESRPNNEQQWRQAKSKLEECSRLLEDLKAADPAHFDTVKADYEHSRGELVRAVQGAQKA